MAMGVAMASAASANGPLGEIVNLVCTKRHKGTVSLTARASCMGFSFSKRNPIGDAEVAVGAEAIITKGSDISGTSIQLNSSSMKFSGLIWVWAIILSRVSSICIESGGAGLLLTNFAGIKPKPLTDPYGATD